MTSYCACLDCKGNKTENILLLIAFTDAVSLLQSLPAVQCRMRSVAFFRKVVSFVADSLKREFSAQVNLRQHGCAA